MLVAMFATAAGRRSLQTSGPWLAAATAAAACLPFLLWQASHGWPTLEQLARGREVKNVALSPLDVLAALPLELGPMNLALLAIGFWWLLRTPKWRPA